MFKSYIRLFVLGGIYATLAYPTSGQSQSCQGLFLSGVNSINSSQHSAITNLFEFNKSQIQAAQQLNEMKGQLAKLEAEEHALQKSTSMKSLITLVSGKSKEVTLQNSQQQIADLKSKITISQKSAIETKLKLKQDVQSQLRASLTESMDKLVAGPTDITHFEVLSFSDPIAMGSRLMTIARIKDLDTQKMYEFAYLSNPSGGRWVVSFEKAIFEKNPDYYMEIGHGNTINIRTLEFVPHTELSLLLANEGVSLDKESLDRLALKYIQSEALGSQIRHLLFFNKLQKLNRDSENGADPQLVSEVLRFQSLVFTHSTKQILPLRFLLQIIRLDAQAQFRIKTFFEIINNQIIKSENNTFSRELFLTLFAKHLSAEYQMLQNHLVKGSQEPLNEYLYSLSSAPEEIKATLFKGINFDSKINDTDLQIRSFMNRTNESYSIPILSSYYEKKK